MGLTDKLLDIQKNLPEFKKNAENPHFKNTYITLDGVLAQLLPLLNERGLLLIQSPSNVEGAPSLLTTVTDSESGEFVESEQPLILDRQNPQGHGSALTYARRYALCGIFNIVADEDDDGMEASRSSKSTSGKSGRKSTENTSTQTDRKF